MGTRERRQRQLEDRKDLILHCAREVIHDDGLLNLQMSRIAEKCEYAVGTLYKHFESKEDLILALAIQGAQKHVELFEKVAQWKANSRDRMFGITVADMVFVRRNPDHFRISQYALCEVVWKTATPERRQEFLKASKPVGEIVVSIVDAAVKAGDLKLNGLRPEQITTGLWSITVGMHNLVHAKGVLEDWEINEPYRLMSRYMQVMLNGFGWQPLADPADEKAMDGRIDQLCKEVFDDVLCD
jgi:AcrR family transcriptional regulator